MVNFIDNITVTNKYMDAKPSVYIVEPIITELHGSMGTETGIPIFDNSNTNYLELHVTDSFGNIIATNYNVVGWDITTSNNGAASSVLKINIHEDIRDLGVVSGKFNCKYAFFKSIIGTPLSTPLSIDKISDSRTEIRVIFNPISYSSGIYDANVINSAINIDRWDNNIVRYRQKRNLCLNFGDGIYRTTSSWKKDTWSYSNSDIIAIIYKLEEPIPDTVQVGDSLSLAYQHVGTFSKTIELIAANESVNVTVLSKPNFNARTNNNVQKNETAYGNWNQLISSNDQLSNKIINNYFSGSAVELNVDYSQFENFIFYSSIEHRINNFKYKIGKIENFDASISLLLSATSASVTSSTAIQNNVNSYNSDKNKIIGSFDAFENYLYYQSSSYLNNSYGEFKSRTWPKQNSTAPYSLYSYSSSQAEAWYDEIITDAIFYDKNNIYALVNSIPPHIRLDQYSEQYVTFIQLVAQQFDLIWLYVKNSLQHLDRDESIYNGLSKDLVYYALNSMGWTSTDDHQFDDLWQYLLGTDESGNTLTPSINATLQPSQSLINVASQSMATRDINKEIWKRTLNNLPYLLKTKGSKRSMQALMNIYGVPSTILKVREYGGPEPAGNVSHFKYDKFNYALNFNGHNSVIIPKYKLQQTGRTPDAIEFRFNTVNGDYFNFPSTNNSWSYQSLLRTETGDISFNIERTAGTLANLTMTWVVETGSVNYEGKKIIVSDSNIFDGGWWSILINKNEPTDSISSSGSLTVYLKESNYAEITNEYSGTIDFSELHPSESICYGIKKAFISSSNWRLGGGEAGTSGSISGSSQSYLNLYPFTGSMQEFRYWATSLSETAFDNHVCSPTSHNFTYSTGSYDNLVMRLPLGTDLKTEYQVINNDTIITSIHPNTTNSTFENGENIEAVYLDHNNKSLSASFYKNVEEYATEWPDLSANRSISNKIRIEDSELNGVLNIYKSQIASSYDLFPLDSPKLGVNLSPTHEVNENIAEYMGGFRIDNYIGDYSQLFDNHYEQLDDLRRYYFKQYTGSSNTIDYMRLAQYFEPSLWEQIKKIAPAHAAVDTGLVIEPHLLNRSKARSMVSLPTATEIQTTTSLDLRLDTKLNGDDKTFDASISNIYNLNAITELNDSIGSISTFSSSMVSGDIQSIGNFTFVDNVIDMLVLNTSDYPDQHIQLLRNGSNWFTSSIDIRYSEWMQPYVSASRSSQFLKYQTVSMSITPDLQTIYHRTYYPADIQDNIPLAVRNQRWNGCKIESSDFNIPSPLTPDGGPVVEYFTANANSIIVNNDIVFDEDSAVGSGLRVL